MNELINLGNGQFVKVTMLKGEKGSNIATITKTGTSGLVDTYTVTLTDGSTTTFEVKNGKTIVSVVKTGTSGLVDTYTITYNDNTTSTFTVTNGRGIERIDKTWTSGLVDTYTITYNDGTTSTFDVTNGNAESLQDAIKASSCAIKAGVSQVEFTQLGNAYITYIPNSECVENAIVVVCFDNGSMYKGTLNYSSTIGRWGISDVSLIQGSDVPATWNVGYGNDSVGTRAFRTGTDFVFSNGVGIALSTSSSVVSYYCVLNNGRVSDNYLQTSKANINLNDPEHTILSSTASSGDEKNATPVHWQNGHPFIYVDGSVINLGLLSEINAKLDKAIGFQYSYITNTNIDTDSHNFVGWLNGYSANVTGTFPNSDKNHQWFFISMDSQTQLLTALDDTYLNGIWIRHRDSKQANYSSWINKSIPISVTLFDGDITDGQTLTLPSFDPTHVDKLIFLFYDNGSNTFSEGVFDVQKYYNIAINSNFKMPCFANLSGSGPYAGYFGIIPYQLRTGAQIDFAGNPTFKAQMHLRRVTATLFK